MEACDVYFYIQLSIFLQKNQKIISQMHVVFAILLVIELIKHTMQKQMKLSYMSIQREEHMFLGFSCLIKDILPVSFFLNQVPLYFVQSKFKCYKTNLKW